MNFNAFSSPDHSSSYRRQAINIAENFDNHPKYSSYRDIRGDTAKNISVAMEIDEESGIKSTGYLLEVREAVDHIRLSAHASTYAKEILIYNDMSVIVIELDRVKKESTQTVYSNNGDIETLRTGWSYERNGLHGPYKQVSFESGNKEACHDAWKKYEALVHQADVTISNKQRFDLR